MPAVLQDREAFLEKNPFLDPIFFFWGGGGANSLYRVLVENYVSPIVQPALLLFTNGLVGQA